MRLGRRRQQQVARLILRTPRPRASAKQPRNAGNKQQNERKIMNNQFDEPRERICSLEPGGQSAPLSRGELTKNLAQSITRVAALKQFGVGLAGMALACFWLLNTARAAGPTFTTFDYPGAVFTDG